MGENKQTRGVQRGERKKNKRKRYLTVLAMFVLFLIVGVLGYGYYLQQKVVKVLDDSYEKVEKKEIEEEVPLTDNISVLIIGVDDSKARDTALLSRSDALLYATLNNESKTVKLLSIPRDSYVYDPIRKVNDKIGHAHAYGDTEGTIRTVENLLELPVDYYVKMDFEAFIDVVDAVGGVTVEVPYDRLELDENDQQTIELKQGEQHLDGRHALAFARTRKLDNDIERGKRQQELLEAVMKESFKVKNVLNYGKMVDAVGENIKTDMRLSEIKQLLAYLKNGLPEITTLNLEGTDDKIDGIYYWQLEPYNLNEVQKELREHLEYERY